MKVFINPGHAPNGVPDPGAVNSYNGLKEAIVASAVAKKLEKYLVNAGVQVVGNLQHDELNVITDTANESGADVFVSIHCNSGPASAEGTETFYYYNSDSGAKLAQCIQSQIVDSLDTRDRGIKPAQPGVNGLYVLSKTTMTAVLVELAFISNWEDCILLEENQEDFARAIARGITDYQLIM